MMSEINRLYIMTFRQFRELTVIKVLLDEIDLINSPILGSVIVPGPIYLSMTVTCLTRTSTDELCVHRIDLEHSMYRHILARQTVVCNASYCVNGAVCQSMPSIGFESIFKLCGIVIDLYSLIILGVISFNGECTLVHLRRVHSEEGGTVIFIM